MEIKRFELFHFTNRKAKLPEQKASDAREEDGQTKMVGVSVDLQFLVTAFDLGYMLLHLPFFPAAKNC